MTKLDLIDQHPELFDSRKDNMKITPLEIEQLRVLSVGNKKLYGTRQPSRELLDKINKDKDKDKNKG